MVVVVVVVVVARRSQRMVIFETARKKLQDTYDLRIIFKIF